MKYLLTIFVPITLFVACTHSNTKEETEIDSTITNVTIRELDSSDAFLALFEDIDPTDLHIFTPDNQKGGSKYQGRVIDSTFYKYFFSDKWFHFSINTSSHFYSCFKFKLSDTKTGLIIRGPSQYDDSAIDLLIWDNSSEKVVNAHYLSDSFGDEGWYFVQDAWLKDLNNDKNIDVITRKRDIEEDLDNDTGKITDTDSLLAWINTNTQFKKTQVELDTAKYKLNHRNL